MEGNDSITVLPAGKGEGWGWLLTDRPFETPKERYTPEELSLIEETYGSWEKAKYQLGFQEEDVEEWKQKRFQILEVGAGFGVSTEELLDWGIDMYALEPSLRFTDEIDEQVVRLKAQFAKPKFRNRVSAAKAVDAALAFPGKQFDVAFAIGPNFQSYSQTDNEILGGISGVIGALSPKDHSYFAFHINYNGTITYGSEETKFNLEQFLIDHKIRYTTRTYLGEFLEETAIRIFRMNDEGQDAKEILDGAIKEDISKYTHP